MPYLQFIRLAQQKRIFLQWSHLARYFDWYEEPEVVRAFRTRGWVPEELTPELVLARYSHYLRYRTRGPE